MFDYDTRAIAMAARLNGGDEHNADPAFKVWADNAKNLRALVDTNDALKNLLVSGDAWVAPWFSSISKVWIDEGAPLAFAVPKEGAVAFPFYLMIGKGSTPDQIGVCSDLINDLLAPDNAARYGELTFAIPVVKNAPQTRSPDERPDDFAEDCPRRRPSRLRQHRRAGRGLARALGPRGEDQPSLGPHPRGAQTREVCRLVSRHTSRPAGQFHWDSLT